MKLKCGWCEKEFDSYDDKSHRVNISDGCTLIEHLDIIHSTTSVNDEDKN